MSEPEFSQDLQDGQDYLNKKIQKLQKIFYLPPLMSSRGYYIGIASLSFRKATESKIMQEGIAVIKQVGEKTVVYDKNLKVL